MKIVGLSGSIVGSKTKKAMNYISKEVSSNIQKQNIR
ncbi:Uncharacterised protein [Lederbergia lenta]|uniref:Uncharacterized protein n=1 Tax=Lederbergia lenta TaxID=1467 RepID=A0A2X4ZAL9_LEDLE|nr:Uncharacterised protein [Lederbergia lenta]